MNMWFQNKIDPKSSFLIDEQQKEKMMNLGWGSSCAAAWLWMIVYGLLVLTYYLILSN
jgi:hypothetical protein